MRKQTEQEIYAEKLKDTTKTRSPGMQYRTLRYAIISAAVFRKGEAARKIPNLIQMKSEWHQILHTYLLGYYELITERSPQNAQNLGTKINYFLLKMGLS